MYLSTPTSLVLLLAIFAALPGQAQDIQRDGPGSVLYLPPITPLPHWYEVRGGSWRVPLETVQELRSLVLAEISRNQHFDPGGEAPRYAIQFRGETSDGQQVVRLIGSCNALTGATWRLSEQFNRVFDGGKCYFDAEYGLKDKQFQFRYHGHA